MSRAVNIRLTTPGWEHELQVIASNFQLYATRGLPLYAQLHKTVEELIRQEKLAQGRQMPPEQALASTLGISLGTVQKGLQSLHSKRLIDREHGRGTFVSSARHSFTSLRFFRFCDPTTNQLLPVYATILERRLVRAGEDQMNISDKNAIDHVRLTRLIDIDGRFTCHSQLFLPASVFGEVMTIPVAHLENINLKQVFMEKLRIELNIKSHMIQCGMPSASVCQDLDIKRQPGMHMEIKEQTDDGKIEIIQKIFVPQTDFALSINLDHNL